MTVHQPVDVELTVNGDRRTATVEPRVNLADLLRRHLGLTGTHVGCEHGSCGACTVLLDGEPIRSCLMFAVQAHGRHVETVESLADGDVLSPLQQAFARHGALQCGYCTPGFLMEGTALLRRSPPPSEQDITAALSSNLCRCTGYEPIERAIRDCLEDRTPEVPKG